MRQYDYLVMDIGSTYTKQRLFKDRRLVASVQAPTSVEDVYKAISRGRQELLGGIDDVTVNARQVLASCSAAGGLRMVAIGYMAKVTAKAAKEVAMNSGSKILEIVSHNDPPEYRIQILREINPDIILLAGGTDYGDTASLIENARLIVQSGVSGVVVLAGNVSAQAEAEEILREGGQPTVRVPNIMPTIHELRVKEAREVIHKEFIKQITRAHGLGAIQQEITNDKVIPTPGAVLLAAELLANGTYMEDGMGDVIVIDLGGATTDVHSIIPGLEELENEEIGLVVSNEKQMSYRTVEGNLGMRVSVLGVLETMDPRAILLKRGIEDAKECEAFVDYCKAVAKEPKRVAATDDEYRYDTYLAETAVEVALKRHAGFLSQSADPVMGIVPGMPIGRDLRNVKRVIGVGGIFAHRRPDEAKQIIANALKYKGISLLPSSPQILLDKDYLLFACGVIGEFDREYAFEIMKTALI